MEKHPRVCGEDFMADDLGEALEETPPRMRGRRDLCAVRAVAEGNTPAYAGKTALSARHLIASEKHPRVCGEDCLSLPRVSRLAETPPRMRGRPCLTAISVLQVGNTPRMRGRRTTDGRLKSATGNTPAYAGKTSFDLFMRPPRWKHPRVCGEDSALSVTRLVVKETPPRMRGRLAQPHLFKIRARNTPAYAGKT